MQNYKLLFPCKSFLTQLPGKIIKGVKNTIAIGSGKGGVGKSTLVVNLAIAFAKQGARVGILDADIYGPSIPLMLGEHKAPIVKGENYLPIIAHGVYAMSIGYLAPENQALIWRGPMLAKSLMQMLNITLWEDIDILLIDLPPGTGDIQLSLVQHIPLTGAIIVTTPQDIATQDAEKALKMFAKTGIDVLGIVENMSYYHCPECGLQDDIFGNSGAIGLAEKYQTSFLGQIPLNKAIRKDCDIGKPSTINDNQISQIFHDISINTYNILNKKPLNYQIKMPEVTVE